MSVISQGDEGSATVTRGRHGCQVSAPGSPNRCASQADSASSILGTWSLAKGAIQTTNIYDMDKTAIAIGNGKLLSPEAFKTMTNTKMRDQGGPVPGCPQCHRGNDAYTYGMGVVIKGNWLLQDPLCNGYSALEAYLPSQRIAISLVVTFAEGAFEKTAGSYPNEAAGCPGQAGQRS